MKVQSVHLCVGWEIQYKSSNVRESYRSMSCEADLDSKNKIKSESE
jgi:hypothetical protein